MDEDEPLLGYPCTCPACAAPTMILLATQDDEPAGFICTDCGMGAGPVVDSPKTDPGAER